MKTELNQSAESPKKASQKKEQINWRETAIKASALFITAFAAGAASAAGSRSFNFVANSLGKSGSDFEGNVLPMNRHAM